MKTYIRNAKVITPSGCADRVVIVDEGKILGLASNVEMEPGAQVVDAGGLYLSPGFIDLHVHGGGTHSTMSGDPEKIAAMCRAHAWNGTTGILPTTSAASWEAIGAAVKAVKAAQCMEGGETILGVHMEGPCLSVEQCGAQSVEWLRTPREFDVLSLVAMWPEGVKLIGVAPELDGAHELAEQLAARGIVVSISHSNATYEQVEEAMRHGFSDVTHLYSGCSGMIRVNSYRIPGVIEAGLNLDGLTCQVIGDGKHLPLSLLSLIYRCKGAQNIILITDGLEYAAAPIEEGTVIEHANGRKVIYEDGVMKLLSRQSFCGSVATMSRTVRNMHAAGAPLLEAVRMATENPARRIGENNKGRIAPGMDADLILFDENVDVKWCMIGGRILRSDI